MTRFGPSRASRLKRIAAAAAIVGMASGCTNTVNIEGHFPAPLVERMPLEIGVYYDDAFRNYFYEQSIHHGPTWHINLGEPNVQLFDQVLAGMFEDVVMVDDPDTMTEAIPGIDGILKPEIEEFALLSPVDSGLGFFSVSIKYRLNLYNPDGSFATSLVFTAYGKNRVEGLSQEDDLKDAIMIALRDAAAAVAVELGEKARIKTLVLEEGARETLAN